MSKCTKAKNPCKICLTPVTHKTGLQCLGACQCWVHYSCLNYTPGKIRDIKAGIIKVSCPCPDCKTSLPKEYRTDQPYSCNNTQCPANQPPKCENIQCPTNHGGRGMMPQAPPCPLSTCGNQCKQYSSPHLPDNKGAGGAPPPMQPRQPCISDTYGPEPSSDACLSINPKCPSGCSSTNDVSGDFGVHQKSSMPQGANFAVVEQMCNTVGELTNQIKELMIQMKQAANQGGGGGPPPKKACPIQSPQENSKETCPKPCYCPGNPARRM